MDRDSLGAPLVRKLDYLAFPLHCLPLIFAATTSWRACGGGIAQFAELQLVSFSCPFCACDDGNDNDQLSDPAADNGLEDLGGSYAVKFNL